MNKHKSININQSQEEMDMTQYKTREEILEFLAKVDIELKRQGEAAKERWKESEKDAKEFTHAISEVHRLIALGEEFREMQRQDDISQEQEKR